MHQEVLLSYRVLFGYNSASRTRLKQLEPHGSPMPPFAEKLIGPPHRRFLSKMRRAPAEAQNLPVSFWPVGARTTDDQAGCGEPPLVQEEYNGSEFPIFGPRLSALQSFCENQRPRDFWGIFRDRRNKLSWAEFWALVIFGVTAFLLALVQTSLSIVQTIVAVKGYNRGQ